MLAGAPENVKKPGHSEPKILLVPYGFPRDGRGRIPGSGQVCESISEVADSIAELWLDTTSLASLAESM